MEIMYYYAINVWSNKYPDAIELLFLPRLYYGMLERLQDRVADIRAQAVTALQRLQDPKNEDCPIIKVKCSQLFLIST